jgi:hypothetical protein
LALAVSLALVVSGIRWSSGGDAANCRCVSVCLITARSIVLHKLMAHKQHQSPTVLREKMLCANYHIVTSLIACHGN